MESNADYRKGIAAFRRRHQEAPGISHPVETLTTSDGPDGTTIFAVRDRETFTIGIHDAQDRQIGVMAGIDNVPHGLMLAEGYVQGYYAGIRAGQKKLYRDVCALLGVRPDPQALANIGAPGAKP